METRKITRLFILLVIILTLWQCKNKEEDDIRLITIQGSNVRRFLDFDAVFTKLDSLGYVNLLTKNGDWLSTENFFISVRRNLPDTLRINELDSLIYINGHLAGISIGKDSPPLPFFQQLSAEEIAHLRIIQIVMPLEDSVRPFLEKIALLNPKVDIAYFSEIDSLDLLNRDLLWLSKNFSPRALFLENEIDSVSVSSLIKFPLLETLLITHPIKGDGKLPHLPHLKEIILYNIDDSTYISADFFKENPALERLAIVESAGSNIDWTSLRSLTNLRHLHIESDSIVLHDPYRNYPHLKSLHLGSYKEAGSISGLFNKNKLTWLSLNPSDDPFMGQNMTVLKDSFPELEYLEFENNDSLLDYQNLKNLKKLKYLVVFGQVGLDSTLYNFDQLHYLSLSKEFLKDSTNVIKLQRELPNTIIVPNSGACLGSGWLLLIIPLAVIWFYFLRSKIHGNQ